MLQSKSFRDPSGYVIINHNEVKRIIKKNETYLDLWSNSFIIKNLIQKKHLISYSVLNETCDEIILKHPKIDFISYPFEWSASMLYDAADLTINLAIDLLKEQKGLKDASAYNILFQGTKPIFVDFCSIEKRTTATPYWLAFFQFTRMFLLPLYLNRFYNIEIASMLLNNLEGLDYNYVKKIVRRFYPLEISLIHLPYLLSKSKNEKIYQNRPLKNFKLSLFITERILKKAQKHLTKVKPKQVKKSNWSNYLHQISHYSTNEFRQKCLWVQDVIAKIKPKKVLDIGCNTGHFSIIAAKQNAKVISIDYDETVIDLLFKYAKSQKLNIQPLVINIARPTPSMGWENAEYFSFLQRADKYFDLVMMLAIIHHLLITDRIPMQEIAKLVNKLTTSYLIIEFIDQNDPMFIKLTRGRDLLYNHITFQFFKDSFSKYFEFINETKKDYHSTRKLLLLKKKT
jgi:2-polyprenyl-3-methyl-5-hydroxy-6-metoxy-1,4-benzoquinol methylase